MQCSPKLARLCRIGAVALAFAPALAHAQVDTADAADSGDTALVIGCALVGLGLIVPGIVLHHGARLRTQAMTALALQAGALVAIVSLLWVMAGYSVGFGNVTNGWLGSGNAWMLADLANVRGTSAVPETAFVALQLAFAVLAVLLLTGGWAERGKTGWAIGFAGLWSVLVYAPIAHWLWGGGWLAARLGAIDLGGALVVHASAGISALVLTLLIGRRVRFDDGEEHGLPALALTGTGMMWIALLALTAGSTLAASDDAATALLNAMAAAATGALAWLAIDGVFTGRAQPTALGRGAMAGLVSASAAAGAMSAGGAILGALIAVAVCRLAVGFLHHAGIDDAVDVVAVHGIGGLTGAGLAAGLIAARLGGTGYAAGSDLLHQIMAQAVAAVAVIAWSVIGTAIAALMVAMVVPMRVSEAEESA